MRGLGRGLCIALALSVAVGLAPSALAAPPLDWPQRLVGTTAESGRDGTGVLVAVLDSGIDKTHPDLQGRFWTNPDDPADSLDNDLNGYVDDVEGWDFCHDAPARRVPGYTHGTMVAGTLAGSGAGGGARGAAPGVTIMDLEVSCDQDDWPAGPTPDDTRGRDSLRAAFRYAIAEGVDIIVMSLQLWPDHEPGTVPALLDLVQPSPEEFQAAYDAGIVVVGAAGNFGEAGPDEPGSRPHVITVGATTGCGFRHGLSNFGPAVEIWAPGRAYTTLLGGGHKWVVGTSFATPLVAGAAALLLEEEPGLSPDAVLARLLETARATPDGPVLDLRGHFGLAPEGGRATLRLNGTSAVGGPSFVQYASSGDEPVLLEVGAVGYGEYCFNLADPHESGAGYVVSPASGEKLQVFARAHGVGWTGPWLNTTFMFEPDGPRAEQRPVWAASAPPSDDGPKGAPAVHALALALGLLAATVARRS